MTREEINKEITFANMVLGAIKNVKTPMLMYDNDIEAESEEEAFEIASDYAMDGGCWQRSVELIEESEDEE